MVAKAIQLTNRTTTAMVIALLTTFAVSFARAQEDVEHQPSGLALAVAMEQSMEAAIAKAEKSVVAIARVRGYRDPSDPQANDLRSPRFGLADNQFSNDPTDPNFVPSEFGTGVIFDRSGLILTTCDVLGDLEEHASNRFYVTAADRKVREAQIAAADPRSNLAVLRVEGQDLTPITFGDGGKLRKGQIVIALGNPYAIARDGQASASWGIVSNLQRKAGPTPTESNPTGKTTLYHLGTLIQTDAKLNLGTSGGALLNLRGEMIGLTTSLAAAAGYEQAAGYAIPIDDTFRRILNELKNGKAVQYGFLGVVGVSPMQFAGSTPSEHPGVLVQNVVRGGPAERSGIQMNDLITHVNGTPIHDFDGLVLHVGSLPAGEQVELSVERGKRRIPIKLTLSKSRVQGTPVVTNPDPAWRGLHVDYWTAVIDLRYYDREASYAVDEQGCVMVTDVESESAAAKAGFKSNMAITHVNGNRISSPKEFYTAVEKTIGPVSLRVTGATADAADELIVAAD